MKMNITTEWEKMVLGCGAGQPAAFSTIMLVPETSSRNGGLSQLQPGAIPALPSRQDPYLS